MASTNNLRNINDIIAGILSDAETEVERTSASIRERARERVKDVEANRLAFALLDGAGFDLDLPSWRRGDHYTLELGFFPSTKAGNAMMAERVRAVRIALGCRLEMYAKDVGDAKLKQVQFTLRPVDFPGIRIQYNRKLPKSGAKCRIVRHRSSYTSLVCDVE